MTARICLLVFLCSTASAADLRDLIELYSQDRAALNRLYAPPGAGRFSFGRDEDPTPERAARIRRFFQDQDASLDRVSFSALDPAGRIDWVLFRNHLRHELRQVEFEEKAREETAPLLPFAGVILSLDEGRRRMDSVDPAKAAATIDALSRQIRDARKKTEAAKPGRIVANRAGQEVERLRTRLRGWFNFHNGYNPAFSWWVDAPYKAVDKTLGDYAGSLRGLAGSRGGDDGEIIGNPIGREALLADLAYEMIPYTPEELVGIAGKEFAWCEREMKKAAHELGFGDEWHKALEHVKTKYVEPGKQPELIRELALQAIEFIDKRNLVTVPPLAREMWRMEMMSPERQLVSPFFLGGEVIQVSYPTSTMTHEQKMMSMRGNNRHFSHATVFHELIPGHHLQSFMAARYRPYRSAFSTPFLTEGWALYWEFLMWDLNFHATPEDRVGALFWRMHRSARIIFSLGFHLGTMTPQQAIDMLVERVGHERDNATAEVRRSFNGTYPPLYQAAYLLGGLQVRALRRELVDAGRMTDRDFHDAILKENRIPVEMIRAALTGRPPDRDFKSSWRFYEQGASR